MSGIILKQDCVYARDTAQQGIEIINLVSILGPPIMLTVAEMFKVRAYIRMYIKNLKLVTIKNDKQL
ncbi:hypothetical protein [Clostridium sp.]|uniref:hypothetical protein n=1 Tax=Clostridium sp. TaxID=1506 RepID=UPI001A3E8D3D|nr:hypothetical protein [Clostridium sp.]MBK5234676.1 hypothetical protein [Clostridium sp.]